MRSEILRLLSACAAVLSLVVTGLASAGGPPPPNVVLIVSDDAGYNEFGYTGVNDFLTPNIDALAQGGIRFTQGYVTQPQCSPARAALMMSRYQQRFGYEHNPSPIEIGDDGLDGPQVTLIEHFNALGYVTGVIGKWHIGSQIGINDPLSQGADEFFGFIGGSRRYWYSPGHADQQKIRRGLTIIENVWPTEGNPADYDPVMGRYLTDAYGDEAAAFVNAHAAEPFFLYLPFNAPHEPLEAKQQDLAMFPTLTGNQQIIAAMTLAMDRAIGTLIDALVANGIDQNTVIVFMNDNGGRLDLGQDNAPFRGGKGDPYEGGIRVPFLMSVPWLTGDVDYDAPVAAIDLGPTLLGIAGGSVPETDGVDLMPYLTGQIQTDPHDILYFRHWRKFAIREGDWKLVRPHWNLPKALFNVTADPGEQVDLITVNPTMAETLLKKMTIWESDVLKPRWWANGNLDMVNRFDHFRYSAVTGQWDDELIWFDAATDTPSTMRGEDAYANNIVEFPAAAADYDAQHNLKRLVGEIYMLNQVRFTGDTETSGSTATIHGNPLLFVDDLTGTLPEIQLGDVTALARDGETDGVPGFTFRLENDLELMHDLRFTGSGPHGYVLTGTITEYEPGRTITKLGQSTLTIAGDASITGTLALDEGVIIIDGPDTEVTQLAQAPVAAGATLALANGGLIQAPVQVTGALTGQGIVDGTVESQGVVAPGDSLGVLSITGDYRQHVPGGGQGVLEIELGGTLVSQYDRLSVAGTAELSGTLNVTEVDGFQAPPGQGFLILSAGVINGTFDTVNIPAGLTICYAPDSVVVRGNACTCFGDVDEDGEVGFSDVLALIGAWGPCAACPEDLDSSGDVGFSDILLVIGTWGPCL